MHRMRKRGTAERADFGRRPRWGAHATALFAGALSLFTAWGPAWGAPSKLQCAHIPSLIETSLRQHIEFRHLSQELRDRVADSYLRRLDPSRSLLLREEAEAARGEILAFFEDLPEGRCGRLAALQEQIVARHLEVEEFARQALSDDAYRIDVDAALVLDPNEREFPAGAAEHRELHRKLFHFQMANYLANGEEFDEAKSKLIHRYELMSRRAREVDSQDLYGRFLQAFANSLDPHSDYFSSERYDDFLIHLSLRLEGIGAVLSSRDGYTIVEEIVPGGAADIDGRLRPKDKILAVGQSADALQDVVDMDLRDVVQQIRGEKGSTVWLGILRQGAEVERLTFALVRAEINLEQRAAQLRFEQMGRSAKNYKLAVLELPSFYGDRNPTRRQASRDVRRLLARVRLEGADGLLLDLSRNNGGHLEYAVEITGQFVLDGGLVAVRNARYPPQILEDPDPGIQYTGPLVVLTSRVTASAGEILAGAIQDYRRGAVVGDDHTFGKGSVQRIVELEQGLGALKLTTGLYFRPGGESTQRVGVDADIELPSLTGTAGFGDAEQPYSLPARTIEPFWHPTWETADGASAEAPNVGYRPLDEEIVERLRERSAERVADDERFADIVEERAKVEQRLGKAVRVAELLDDLGIAADGTRLAEAEEASEESGEEGEGEDAGDPDEMSPQLEEALHILVDLIEAES